MNYLFNYPDVLKIKEAIFYDVAPIHFQFLLKTELAGSVMHPFSRAG